MSITTTGASPTEARYQFVRRLDTLNSLNQAGIAEVVQKLLIRTNGDMPLLDAMSQEQIFSNPHYQGKNGRNNFFCERLHWAVNDLELEISGNMTVGDAFNILQESGHQI